MIPVKTIVLFALAAASVAMPLLAQEAVGPRRAAPRVITLAEARRMAIETHPEVRSIDESVTQADLTVRRAWSVLLPRVSASGKVVLNQHEAALEVPDFATFDIANPSAMETEEMVIQEKWSRQVGFQANMTLFNPRAIPLIQVARDNAELSRLTARRKKNDLLFAVTACYYQVHSMNEMIRVAEENRGFAETFLAQAKARKSAGQITQLDVLRARTRLMEAEKQVADAKDAARLATVALAHLIGVAPPFVIAPPAQVAETDDRLEALTERALERRLELKEAALSKRISKRNETETVMKWLPSFDATYDWRVSSEEGFTGENASWMLIFGAKWSLFDGGGRIAELEIRKSLTRQGDYRIENLMRHIREEVEKSFVKTGMTKRNVALAEKQVMLAEETHALVARQYDAGLVTSLDMLSAATALSERRVHQVLERLQYDLALLTLERDVGEYGPLSGAPRPK